MRKLFIISSLLTLHILGAVIANAQSYSGSLSGVVVDSKTGEPVIGAAVFFPALSKGASTDLNGGFSVVNVPPGIHRVEVSCIGYRKIAIEDIEITASDKRVDMVLEEDTNFLDEIVITSVKRMNSQLAVIQATRNANAVVSGMSSREIAKSQDRNAAEVVRRIPGVSVINDRHIIVRGLPSRYNNVWINNSTVPGTEADTRSFSFDILPASQIESIMIVKSQSAEIPSDFSGGFIRIETGSMPEENEIILSVGTGFNSSTHFSKQLYNTASSAGSVRYDQRLNNNDKNRVTEFTREGLNDNWLVRKRTAPADQRASLMLNRAWKLKGGAAAGLTGSLNYSNTSTTYSDMLNARYGVYNITGDTPEYIYKYSDNQYNIDKRIGGMFNLTYMSQKSKIEFRNLVNILEKNRYTQREGWQNVSARYIQEKQEYLYTNRTTYTGQLAGRHDFKQRILDWNAAFSFAGMSQPDRRIINREENGIYGDLYFGQMAIDQNEITRDFVNLKEHIVTAAVNYTSNLPVKSLETEFKAGLLGEYRARDYNNRQFYYRYNIYNLPADFVYRDVVNDILIKENFGSDKLYIYEDTDNRNSYKGEVMAGSAYFSYKINIGKANIIAGVRAEGGTMMLTSFDKIYEFSKFTKEYPYFDIYPSFNGSVNISKKSLIRVAYGKSVNRQEFREVSSSVYYDFNLFSDVKGNPLLKPAKIDNADLRFEHYPAPGEYITLALFYKFFKNPIEWTYLDAGGSYTYTFENAKAADNMGIEAEIRKNLGFAGLPDFSFGLNAAYISSKVRFDKNSSLEKDRPMQGQSPYLVNTSLFYDNKTKGISASVLYNRIGKRIVGIGRADTGSGASINNDVPDTYELPRDLIDITLGKQIGKRCEIKIAARDILNQKIIFQQYPKFVDDNGNLQKRSQDSKSFRPGSYFVLSLQLKF